ncbi:MAG: DUF4956 domain-containing protein [Clostridia bacterium]|nr:DUF4956 domain-containing protein [Clostridia bacterium]
MLDQIFSGILDSGTASGLTIGGFLICVLSALAIGAAFAFAYTYNSTYTKSYVVTLALLPAVVTIIIMMVSGSIGAGVAVAGSFSLVRFRSVPGTAKEICAIFIAMATGLTTGMGYIGFAVIFTLVMSVMWMFYFKSGFGENKNDRTIKTLRITIPEDLDYGGVFDDLFSEYTDSWKLLSAKTTNMGSLYKLTYEMVLLEEKAEKEFIDKLRCRNGNLEISSSLKTVEMSEM